MKKKRFFGSKERVILFLHASGICRICGREIEDGWHGDHIEAFSLGGETNLKNGQALCQKCNLSKSNKQIKNKKSENTSTDKGEEDNK
ncbi:hypothetical protein BH20ACI4_BH20ACI4_20780 [soil metagenome]